MIECLSASGGVECLSASGGSDWTPERFQLRMNFKYILQRYFKEI